MPARDPSVHLRDELLADDAPAVAALRRLVVDEGFLERDRVSYWRP
jgi:hypothetical protein